MALPLKIKIRGGYIVALLLLLISYVLIFYVTSGLKNETKWVAHSYSIINSLHFLKGEFTDAESGIRGYFITKDERYLKPYITGSQNTIPLYNEIKQLTADNKGYKARVDALGDLISRRLKALSDGLDSFEKNGKTIVPTMSANREANKIVTDSIRLIVGQLIYEEQALREMRNSRLRSVFTSAQVITIVSLIIAMLTAIYSFITYNRESKAKEKADKHAIRYSMELEENIEKLRKVNRELQELKSIEKFASTGRIARTIAHEVRNPLTNISLASEQLRETIVQNEDAVVLIEMISRNANRINQLVSDLLNSTRFTQLNYITTDIRDVLDETIHMAHDRIELNNTIVKKEYGEPCLVLIDKEKMKLAFLNIIVNAIEAMEQKRGELQIKTRRQGDKCVIEFTDNGSGMDEEALQKLFEPYFTSKARGNGLGLTNTQNIILNHGGSIHASSKPGEGTSFFITLTIEKEKDKL